LYISYKNQPLIRKRIGRKYPTQGVIIAFLFSFSLLTLQSKHIARQRKKKKKNRKKNYILTVTSMGTGKQRMTASYDTN
jgi:hypothetical protein